MYALSEKAATIFSRMEPNRSYEPSELRAFAPDTSAEGLREIMHELWVKRHVERSGYSGWRRERSTCGAQEPAGSRIASVAGSARHAPDLPPGQTKAVRPEDLFDHDAFSELFR